jgi:hypothetical protein
MSYFNCACPGCRKGEACRAGVLRFLGQVGPLPYDGDPADTRPCSNCTLRNAPDAAVCDQCGEDMPGNPQDYSRREGDDIRCNHCESYNAPDAHFCRICGHPIPLQAFREEAVADWNTPTVNSSSGRDGTDWVSRSFSLETDQDYIDYADSLLAQARAADPFDSDTRPLTQWGRDMDRAERLLAQKRQALAAAEDDDAIAVARRELTAAELGRDRLIRQADEQDRWIRAVWPKDGL